MKEYRVKVSVRNNLILRAIEEMGFSSVSAFCRHYQLAENKINALIGLRQSPINSEGEFRPSAKELMEALGCAPSDIWTDQQLTMALARNSAERSFDECDVQTILENHIQTMTLADPADEMFDKQRATIVHSVLRNLRPQQQQVLQMRFGIGCEEKTLRQCASEMGLTAERIRQIESSALRRLRWQGNSEILTNAEVV